MGLPISVYKTDVLHLLCQIYLYLWMKMFAFWALVQLQASTGKNPGLYRTLGSKFQLNLKHSTTNLSWHQYEDWISSWHVDVSSFIAGLIWDESNSHWQSSWMDFMLRLPNCTDKHQMLIILTNPTSDIWILRLTKQTCWRDLGKTALVDSPHKAPIRWSFNDFCVVSLNKLLNKQYSWIWFEMPCDITVMIFGKIDLVIMEIPPYLFHPAGLLASIEAYQIQFNQIL